MQYSVILDGCPFNGPLNVMKYPTLESPRRDTVSPIKYNGLHVPQPSSLAEQQPVGRWAAIRGSTGCINIQKHNYIANYISRIY